MDSPLPHFLKGRLMAYYVFRLSSVDLSQREVVGVFETADEAFAYRDANVIDTYSNVSTEPDCDYLYISERARP